MGNTRSKQDENSGTKYEIQRNSMGTCNLKIVFVGDSGVGKTCLLLSQTENRFPTDFVSTINYNSYQTSIWIDEEEVMVSYWDTAGNEVYSRLQPLSYPETDIFVLTFSVVCRSSFENIYTQWHPKVTHHVPNAKIIVLGTKIELRNDPKTLETLKEVPFTREDGVKMAKSIGARYFECSAFTQEGLKETFDHILYNNVITRNNRVKSARK